MRGPLPYGISFGQIKNLIKVKFEKDWRKSWMKYAGLYKQDEAQRLQLGWKKFSMVKIYVNKSKTKFNEKKQMSVTHMSVHAI